MNRAFLILTSLLATSIAFAEIKIVLPSDASALERLAAQEVRRYFYLRSGEFLPLVNADRAPKGDSILVARKGRRLVSAVKTSLSREQYAIKSDGTRAYLVGGDDVGTLYAAYRFAEKLGVRFYVHGDVVPDARIAAALPKLEEIGRPLFGIRGIQPFHDFPEGPDWWNRDDYLAYVAQLPKLRMNFIGLHTYPEGGVGPEPAVWIGSPGDLGDGGKVAFSYPSQWANTLRKDMWGYAPMKTSEFAGGASQLFENDEFGPEVMNGVMPRPSTPDGSNRLFNDTGEMFRAVFAQAKDLGVKTCIGTETPLTIPKLVQERLRAQNKDPNDPAVVREVYEGMFRRIAQVYPVDYYWLWTPENWTWGGNKPEQFEATTRDIQAALDALKAIGKPFTVATSGWVLGPQNDRAALDRFLPKDSPMSTINRKVGHAPDEPGFANVVGRPKWVIPWVENDPNMIAPQPWAGRMRYDAADARRLGCTGLLGIHWRTKILAANFAALAAAAWDQSWVPPDFDRKPIPPGQVTSDPSADGQGHEHPSRGRTMPVQEFYIDFARANFGDAVAEQAGAILARIDGVNLPEPTTWIKGPGGIKVEKRPWPEVKSQYAFVQELARLRDKVTGAGNVQRFEYWLGTYRYMAALAEAACIRGQLDRSMGAIQAEQDEAKKRDLARRALEVRTELARAWERMVALQVAATDTPGELGTIANLEQHNRRFLKFLSAHDEALEKALGAPLPDGVQPARAYTGPARIIVPTVRTVASKGEAVSLRIIALDNQPAKEVSLFWRSMGKGDYARTVANHVARSVYRVALPAITGDLEYYIRAETADGKTLFWPATAPSMNQTIVSR